MIIIHICRLYSFQDISEEPQVIDTNCPWYEGAAIYKKYTIQLDNKVALSIHDVNANCFYQRLI